MEKGLQPRDFIDKQKARHDVYKVTMCFTYIFIAALTLACVGKGCNFIVDRAERTAAVKHMYGQNGQALSRQTIDRINGMKPVPVEISGAGADQIIQEDRK